MQKLCLGIHVEIHPNPDCRTFHHRHKFIDSYVSDSDDNMDNISPLTRGLVCSLRKMVGIKKVSAWPYEVNIMKAPLYTWEELEKNIKLSFAKYLPAPKYLP